MRDSWLGKDPGTALKDVDFAIAAKISEWLSVCVHVCALCFCWEALSRRRSRGNSLGKIKMAGSYR